MSKINTLIIDDERLARQELKNLLADFSSFSVAGECGNADEALKLIEDLKPELIFLDIQMPGKNGFQLLEDLSFVPEVIFVTAYDDYAIKAFEYNALDYLLKPVQKERMSETLKRFEEERTTKKENQAPLGLNDQIFVKDGEKCWFVQLQDVRMFESIGNYVRIFFGNNKPLILKSLNSLEERLDNKVFFRANRKYIINLKKVKRIENWFNGGLMVEMEDENKVEISRRQAVKLKDKMSL